MSKVTNSLNMSEYVSNAQLKKKIKSYLNDINCSDFKLSSFSKGLVLSLVTILEDFIMEDKFNEFLLVGIIKKLL
jgi:hypothetical protein